MKLNGLFGANGALQRLAVFFLGFPIILFYALVLVGCVSTSPGIQDIYLISLHGSTTSPNASSNGTLSMSVRIGYFGMCTSTAAKNMICSHTFGHSGSQLASTFLQSNETATASLFDLAATIQSKIFIFLPVISGLIFVISFFLLLGLDRDLKRFDISAKATARRRLMKNASKSSVWTSVAISTAGTVGAQQTSAALQFITGQTNASGNVKMMSGGSLLALQWVIVVLSVIFALGSAIIHSQDPGPPLEEPGAGMMNDEPKFIV